MTDVQSGLVPLLDEQTGRFPDQFAPPSVAADATAAHDAAEAAGRAQEAAEAAENNAAGHEREAGQIVEDATATIPGLISEQVTAQIDPKVAAATQAKDDAETALGAAQTARDDALQAKAQAVAAKEAAAGSAGAAATSAGSAAQAKDDAETALGAAQTARDDALQAKAQAVAAKEAAAGSAGAAATSAGSAAQAKDDAETALGAAQTARDDALQAKAQAVAAKEAVTVLNMVNLFANPRFTLDTNGDGIPDGYGKAGTAAAWTPSLVDGGPFGARYLHATCIAPGTSVALSRSYAVTAGHLYFYGAWVRTTLPDTELYVFCGTTPEYVAVAPDGAWQLAAAISTGTGTTGNVGVVKGTGQYAAGDTLDLSLPIQIDLTAAFGAGNEPTLDHMVRLMSVVGGFEGRYGVAEADRAARAAVGQRTATSREERAQAGVLRVGSFNCPGYADKSSFGARALMQAIDADIWCLQEMFDRIDQSDRRAVAKILGPMLPYRYWTVTNNAILPGWDKGRLFASARPLRNSSWVATPAQGVQRSEITHCGRTIAVYNIHLPSAYAIGAMTTYVNALKSFVDADPTPLKIVAGDWNTPGEQNVGPDGKVDDSALAAFTGTGWTHVQSSIGWQVTKRTDIAVNYRDYLDNVMVSPGLRIVGGGVGPSSRVSDHRPIWADIAFD